MLQSGEAIQRRFARHDCCWQRHAGGGAVDRKSPAIPGYVPKKFVVIAEESQLPVGGVIEFIGMLAAVDVGIFVAKIDAHAVRIIFDARSFRIAIAKSAEPVEANAIVVFEAIFVMRGKLAIDSVAD